MHKVRYNKRLSDILHLYYQVATLEKIDSSIEKLDNTAKPHLFSVRVRPDTVGHVVSYYLKRVSIFIS